MRIKEAAYQLNDNGTYKENERAIEKERKKAKKSMKNNSK